MRKIIVSNVISLDGYFAGPAGELDWMQVDPEFIEYSFDMLSSMDTILFGRVTYQLMVEFWPTAEAIKNDPLVAGKMNGLNKIVFSKTLQSADWNNTILMKDILPEEIVRMKQLPGKDIVILGSGTLVSRLTMLGLIDEFWIILNPVLLSKGKPLFTGLKDRFNLKLLKAKTHRSGKLILYYQPAKI
jgi:dihydrofolate reductase